MINQGMILGRSSFVYRIQGTDTFVTASQRKAHATQRLHVDINLVDNDKLDLEGFAPGGRNTPKQSSSWKTTVPTSADTK